MKILITGGAGFIGSHTADLLIKHGHQVRILDNLSEPIHPLRKARYLPPEAEFIQGDVRNREVFRQVLRGVDAVYHLAAYQDYLTDFSTFFDVNVVGTALLYEIIVAGRLPVQKVIVASSQAVYGEGKYHCPQDGTVYPDIRSLAQLEKGRWEVRCLVCSGAIEPRFCDEARVNPQNQYAISKYSQELIALNLGKRYHIPTVAMRYSIVQGPRQSFSNAYSGVCRIFCLRVLLGQPMVAYEDGQQRRDYVNVYDVAEANRLVLEQEDANGRVFNVGGGRSITVLEFGRIVARVFGQDEEPRVPGKFRYGDTRHVMSDISRLRALGWRPQHPVEDSVRAYVAWLREQSDVRDYTREAEVVMAEQQVVRAKT